MSAQFCDTSVICPFNPFSGNNWRVCLPSFSRFHPFHSLNVLFSRMRSIGPLSLQLVCYCFHYSKDISISYLLFLQKKRLIQNCCETRDPQLWRKYKKSLLTSGIGSGIKILMVEYLCVPPYSIQLSVILSLFSFLINSLPFGVFMRQAPTDERTC